MKVIVETIDNENYVEIVLTDFNMDLLDDGRMLSKEVSFGRSRVSLGIRKQTQEEKYAIEER